MKRRKSDSRPAIDPRFARFRLRVRRSSIDRYGVYACERIPRGSRVIEYTGKLLPYPKVRKTVRNRTPGRTYRIYFNRRVYLEGAIGGSGAEIINHSCEPNLRPRMVKGHILMFSRREIRKGEELTWDYRFSKSDARVPCHCGSKHCRGTINRK